MMLLAEFDWSSSYISHVNATFSNAVGDVPGRSWLYHSFQAGSVCFAFVTIFSFILSGFVDYGLMTYWQKMNW